MSSTAPQTDRFFQSLPRKSLPFGASPDTGDRFVYQDEYVNSLLGLFPGAFGDATKPIHFSLDNEPDLWSSTHAEIQRSGITYAALTRLTIDQAAAVKDVIPQAVIFGPVSYGYTGFVSLQGASDSSGSEWFLESYLRQLKAASGANGRRLVDVLDVHWYTEARSAVAPGDTTNTTYRVSDNWIPSTPQVQAARVQSTRSLWDPSYVESSWITGCCTSGAGIALIPALRTKIAAQNPGTKIAFTEYDHGGAEDITGAVAQADTLGIFGREGVYAATFWSLNNNVASFVRGAFRSFRNYDGAGGAFGDTSFQAISSDESKASVYASLDAGKPGRVVVVITNKTPGALDLQVQLKHTQALTTAQVYRLTAATPLTGSGQSGDRLPQAQTPISFANNAFNLAAVPGYSVTTLVLQ